MPCLKENFRCIYNINALFAGKKSSPKSGFKKQQFSPACSAGSKQKIFPAKNVPLKKGPLSEGREQQQQEQQQQQQQQQTPEQPPQPQPPRQTPLHEKQSARSSGMTSVFRSFFVAILDYK